MTAMLAAILAGFTLKLSVGEQTCHRCGGDKKATWEKTRYQAIRILVDGV